MTASEMLSSLRTKLDESTASMWTDVECYQALTEGQTQLVGLVHEEVLSRNISIANLTGGAYASGVLTIERPSDVLRVISATLESVPVRIVATNKARPRLETNTYMSSTASDPIMYEVRDKSDTKTYYKYSVATSATDDVEIIYIPILDAITSSSNCELLASTHPAIVQYAYAELLKKSDRLQDSIQEFSQFIQIIGMIK